jgi:putative tricarboxylic transport membrane protein
MRGSTQMQNDEGTDGSRPLISNRAMEVIVALVLLGGAAVVIYDSVRLGFGWREGEGPAPGYYPFWVAVILAVASLVNLSKAVFGHGAGEIFVSRRPFGRVLAVLVPSLVFVALIGGLSIGPLDVPGLGIYVASAIFIFFFMIAFGRENPIKAIAISVAVPVALFFMFERWFLVPLPKGPLEAWLLGY